MLERLKLGEQATVETHSILRIEDTNIICYWVVGTIFVKYHIRYHVSILLNVSTLCIYFEIIRGDFLWLFTILLHCNRHKAFSFMAIYIFYIP